MPKAVLSVKQGLDAQFMSVSGLRKKLKACFDLEQMHVFLFEAF